MLAASLHLIKFNKLHLKFELIHNIYHLSPLKAAINQFTSCATIDEEISIRKYVVAYPN